MSARAMLGVLLSYTTSHGMKFYCYDPYLSLFAVSERRFRERSGEPLESARASTKLLQIAVEIADLLGPMTELQWTNWVEGMESLTQLCREHLTEACEIGNVVDQNGNRLRPDWTEYPDSSVVTAYFSMYKSLKDVTGEEPPGLLQGFGSALAFASLQEIDGALAGLMMGDEGGAVAAEAGMQAALILGELKQLLASKGQPPTGAQIGPPNAAKLQAIFSAIREGGRAGGKRSAETRKQNALDHAAVHRAATSLGWPERTAGVNKRLAAKFSCSPERIGQILRRLDRAK